MSALKTGLTVAFFGAVAYYGLQEYESEQAGTEATTQTAPPPPPETPPLQPEAPPSIPGNIETDPSSAGKNKLLSSRPLTDGEVRLVRSIFGNAIDLSGVRLKLFKNPRADFASDVPKGAVKSIEYYGPALYRADFSTAKEPDAFAGFVHDMTQLLQSQQGAAWKRGAVDGYDYPLGQWRFEEYGQQQQRAIMEDYARRFLHADRHTRWVPDTYGGDRTDTDPFLQDLVENRFPDAKAARLAFADVSSRLSTPGELQLVHSVFGDQVDMRSVRLSCLPQAFSDIAAQTFYEDNEIKFYGPDFCSADFSKDKEPSRLETYIHETTHIWQGQTQEQYTPIQDHKIYNYPLETQYRFSSYGAEQQAAMVGDYAAWFLHPTQPRTYTQFLSQVYGESGQRDEENMLAWMVENQFPAARETRLNRQARAAAPASPKL